MLLIKKLESSCDFGCSVLFQTKGIRHLNDLFPVVCSVVIASFYLGLGLYHDMGSHCGYILVCVVIASVLIVVS